MANNMDTTANAEFIPEIIAQESIGALANNLNLGNTVAKDNELTPVSYGAVISIPVRGALTAQQKGENSDASKQKPTATNVQVTINQHWYVKIAEEDRTRAVQPGSVLPSYMEDAVLTLADKIETSLAANILEFDNIDHGGSDNAITSVNLVGERMALNKVPTRARKFGYIHPTFVTELLSENAFVDPKVIPNNNALTEGSVGRVGGFDLFSGNLVPSVGSPAHFQNFFYTRNALVLASRPLREVGSNYGVNSASVQSDAGLALRVMEFYDQDEMALVNQVDTLFGSAVYDERLGFVLESQ